MENGEIHIQHACLGLKVTWEDVIAFSIVFFVVDVDVVTRRPLRSHFYCWRLDSFRIEMLAK